MFDHIKSAVVATWAKVKAACLGSVTMAWSYVVTTAGTLLANIDSLATVLGDPGLNQQVTAVIGDAKAVGKWLLAVGIVTAVARLKSLILTSKG